MFRKIVIAAAFIMAFSSVSAYATDVKMKFTLEDAKMYSEVRTLLDGSIGLYWGDQPVTVEGKHGTFKTSKRTNGFMKEASEACAHALASALIVLQERAEREGGNAVINIMSNIQGREESSSTEYSCLVGSVMVNVALKGTVATVKK